MYPDGAQGHQGPISGLLLEMDLTGQVWATFLEGLCALCWRPLPFITPSGVAALVPTPHRLENSVWKGSVIRESHTGHAAQPQTQRGL